MHFIFKFIIVMCTVALTLTVLAHVNSQFAETGTGQSDITSYEQAVPPGFSSSNTERVLDPRDAGRIMQPSQELQEVTERIIASCGEDDKECQLRAIYTWLRTHIEHTEVIQVRNHILTPEETLLFRQGDDLALSVLLSAMLRSQDIPARIARTPYSTFVKATLNNEFVRIDLGCVNCGLNSVRYQGTDERITWIT